MKKGNETGREKEKKEEEEKIPIKGEGSSLRYNLSKLATVWDPYFERSTSWPTFWWDKKDFSL